MKIAITGSTGQLGQLIVSGLKEKVPAGNIIGLARSPEKGNDLGVKIRSADYDNLETLSTALNGVDTLILVSGSEVGKRASQHQNILDAAKKNNVQRIIYTSVLHADNTTISLAAEHLATEKSLRDSGIPFTILRNGWYNENYAGSLPGAIAGGAVLGSAGNGKISAAARKDFAEAAVVVATSPGHEGKVYELAGDDAFTLTELAAELSRHAGKDIPYKNLPEPEYAAILTSFGLPETLAGMIANWDTSISKGDLFDDKKQLSKLIGRPTTPVSEMIRDTLKANLK